MFSLIMKQKADGQIRVSSVQVDSDTYHEDPFIKGRIRNEVENGLEDLNIRVLKDKGVVDYG